MVTDFYPADMAAKQKSKKVHEYLHALHRTNADDMKDKTRGFPEFVPGNNFTSGGRRHQGWNVTEAITDYHAIDGQKMFRIDDNAK